LAAKRAGHRRVLVTGAGAAIALLLISGAGSASASPDTLRLAFEDILMGAADVVVSPVNAGFATAENMEHVSDNAWLQGLYVVPGFLGLAVLQAGQGALRVLVGAVEVLPGLALFPFDRDLGEGFNVFRRGELMLDARNPLGENPPWLAYVLPLTPATIDARIGPRCPWATYTEPVVDDDPAARGR
jgi:hypothetical protein